MMATASLLDGRRMQSATIQRVGAEVSEDMVYIRAKLVNLIQSAGKKTDDVQLGAEPRDRLVDRAKSN